MGTPQPKEKKLSLMESMIGFADFILQEQDTERKQKRKFSNQIDERAGPKKKHSRKKFKTVDKEVDSVDLISQLPENIIHHILSFLRCNKDAVRTSILSKKWKDIWSHFSILDFDQRKFQPQEKKIRGYTRRQVEEIRKKNEKENERKQQMFRNFVENTLQSRHEQKSAVQKFKLHMTSYDFKWADHINRWIGFATESNIQELDLHVPFKKNVYILPQTVFAAKTITALRVSGCCLGACNDIKLPNLQKICLGQLHLCEQMMQNLILSCPLIEDLRLINCTGLTNLLVSSNKLKRVDLHLCVGLKDVELQAPSLQTFCYHGKKPMPCKINLAMCKCLKSLTLEDGRMRDDLFQNQLSNFPVLEQLILTKCHALKSMTISSHWLRTLVLRDCKKLIEADIDTPNLQSFEYKGHKMPFSSLNPSGLKEAKFYFETEPCHKLFENNNHVWFPRLQELLGKFDLSKGLKLVVRSKKNVIIHEDLREILIPPIYNLKLEIVKSSTSLDDLLNNLLRTWHPETLYVASSTISNFSKQVYEKVMKKEKEPSCCKYNSSNNKCWRHFLEDVIIENLDDNLDGPGWNGWLSSVSTVNQLTVFRFFWGDH